jgi:CheY-like chemotaxis protein
VVDLNMPVMGGRAAIKVLQAIKPELRVIAVSGSDDAARAKGQGEEHELTKPYAMGDLLRCLREVLDQPPAGATSEERIP